MAGVELVYCADGGRRFAAIAVAAGYRYGAQLPGTTHHPLWFADQNWRKPNRTRYMGELARLRPVVATVTDLEREDQLPAVLDEAEEAAQWVERVVIIPKAQGVIDRLPRQVNGCDVVLGYSVPTKFAGTPVPAWDFAGWPVHLLGGGPQPQMRLARYLNVISADGNAATAAAKQGRWYSARLDRWQGGPGCTEIPAGPDMPYRAFARSCEEILTAWQKAGLRG